MGDLQRKISTADKILARQTRQKETVHEENRTIEKVVPKTKSKDKAISARVNGTTYSKFRKICEARGLTSNACLNMLITDFVRENAGVIEESYSR